MTFYDVVLETVVAVAGECRYVRPFSMWCVIMSVKAVSYHALFPMERILTVSTVPNIDESLINEYYPQFANAARVTMYHLSIFDYIVEFTCGQRLKLLVEF